MYIYTLFKLHSSEFIKMIGEFNNQSSHGSFTFMVHKIPSTSIFKHYTQRTLVAVDETLNQKSPTKVFSINQKEFPSNLRSAVYAVSQIVPSLYRDRLHLNHKTHFLSRPSSCTARPLKHLRLE